MALCTGYYAAEDELRRRLREPAPGRVQLLTGPRQVGKTTLLLQVAAKWGARAIYAAADAPEAALPHWWGEQWDRARSAASTGAAVLLLDEIQYLPDWSRLLKAELDRIHRTRAPLHVVATGSASLGVGAGSRETMAGRFERITLTHWSAGDLAQGFGLEPEQATELVVRLGAFPGAMSLRDDLPRWRAYIRDAIIDPAVGRDLLLLEPVRKPALLRQVFAIAAGHPAEIISLQKLVGLLAEQGSRQTVAEYLALLGEAYLVAALPKFAAHEIRRRAAPPKLVPLSNAFPAAVESAAIGALPSPDRWGRLVENACLAFAVNSGQDVSYWREEPREVDAVIEGSWGQWSMEVKTGAYLPSDVRGLEEFVRRFPEYRPLVVCDPDYTGTARAMGLQALSWHEFLWSGVAGLP